MLQNKIEQIISSVKRLQNGIVSESMQQMGLNYGVNYGVSLLHLKGLADKYEKNTDLAFALLSLDIRETKILASMLFETKMITIDQLLSVSTAINNVELVEQFSRNLFSKCPNSLEVIKIMVESGGWQKILAIYSVSWAIRFKNSEVDETIAWASKQFLADIQCNDKLIQKGTYLLMQSVAGFSKAYKDVMLETAQKIIKENNETASEIVKDFILNYSN